MVNSIKNLGINVSKGNYFDTWTKPLDCKNKIAVLALAFFRVVAFAIILPELITFLITWKNKGNTPPRIDVLPPQPIQDVEQAAILNPLPPPRIQNAEVRNDPAPLVAPNRGIAMARGPSTFFDAVPREALHPFKSLSKLQQGDRITINYIVYEADLISSFPSKLKVMEYDEDGKKPWVRIGTGKVYNEFRLSIIHDPRPHLKLNFDQRGIFQKSIHDILQTERFLTCLKLNDSLTINGKKYSVVDISQETDDFEDQELAFKFDEENPYDEYLIFCKDGLRVEIHLDRLFDLIP